MPTLLGVLLDPAVVLQVALFLDRHDVVGIGIIDGIVSDARYRHAWLELLR
jgi:hypothetical protein